MKKILSAALLALFCLQALAIDKAPAFEDPAQQARYEHLARELRCLVCRSETIADSNAQLAVDLRRQLRELMAAGKSDEEILQYMTDRYGDYVLYKPPVVPRTLSAVGRAGVAGSRRRHCCGHRDLAQIQTARYRSQRSWPGWLVTAFIVVCVAMLLAALVVDGAAAAACARRPGRANDVSSYRKERRFSSIAVAVLVPVLAVVMYAGLSNWDWKTVQTESAQAANMEQALSQLEAKLAQNPKNVEGWMMLGRSYAAIGRYPRAADAYQQAYDLTQGQNVEAIIGLGEALALTDEASLTGRAGKLFETALIMAPNHPKALWYGSVAALRSGDLRRGRDRLQLLMAQNPPEELRGVLERQIQDLNQQLGEAGQQAGQGAAPPVSANSEAPAAAGSRSIKVSVSLAPQLRDKVSGSAVVVHPGPRSERAGVRRWRCKDAAPASCR